MLLIMADAWQHQFVDVFDGNLTNVPQANLIKLAKSCRDSPIRY